MTARSTQQPGGHQELTLALSRSPTQPQECREKRRHNTCNNDRKKQRQRLSALPLVALLLLSCWALLSFTRRQTHLHQHNHKHNHPSSLRRRLFATAQHQERQLDLLVPIFERDENLRQFATRLQAPLQEYARISRHNATRIGTVRLLTTRYGHEQTTSNQVQQELAHLTGLALEQIVLVHAPPHVNFSRAHAVNLMLEHACHDPHCVVARMDVDMQIKPVFFVHAAEYAQQGQVYFPIVWSAYHSMSPPLVQFRLDLQQRAKKGPRIVVQEYSKHQGHWRQWGTGMWAISGPDAAHFRFDENFKGWGGEDGDFYNRIKQQRHVIRHNEPGLIHLWHPKWCTRGVTVFTDTQVTECNWSRDGEKGSEWGRTLVDKWWIQHGYDLQGGIRTLPTEKPIWQA